MLRFIRAADFKQVTLWVSNIKVAYAEGIGYRFSCRKLHHTFGEENANNCLAFGNLLTNNLIDFTIGFSGFSASLFEKSLRHFPAKQPLPSRKE